ncbi:MAG TPA: acylphosphatase [Devosia sp.]|jgi:acylphosphatase|nr:acylphosphatase [Devosia sp.]
MQKSVHARITGRVQGVGFRNWMEATARRLGLSGWVRNRRDGSVEASISGDTSKVDELLTLCWAGPPSAKVEEVETESTEPTQAAGFKTLPTE